MECSICFETLCLRPCKQCNYGVCDECAFKISSISDVSLVSKIEIKTICVFFKIKKIKSETKQISLSYSCPICRMSQSFELNNFLPQLKTFLLSLKNQSFKFKGKENDYVICSLDSNSKLVFEESFNN